MFVTETFDCIWNDDIVEHDLFHAEQGNGKGEQHVFVAHERPKGHGGDEAQQIPRRRHATAAHQHPRESLQTKEYKGKEYGTQRIDIVELCDELGHIVGQSTRHTDALGEVGGGEEKQLILLLVAERTAVRKGPEERYGDGEEQGKEALQMLMNERPHKKGS